MGSFLDKRCMHWLSGVRKLLGAVWVIPRQGIKLYRTNALNQIYVIANTIEVIFHFQIVA